MDNQIPWLSLPHRSQLLTLALCQLSELLVQSSIISYLYFYLSSLYTPDQLSPTPGMITAQAGMLASNFLLFQVLASTFWGRMSDRIGRKPCVLIGLAGITISTLGFGFSESMGAAVFWSILGGALSGNVGVLRTMIMETFDEDRYQSRALLMFPMSQNVGIVAGALIGGLLADPAGTWPGVWGGIGWVTRWKFALPNMINAGILVVSWILVFLFLKETQEKRKSRRDWGIEVRRTVQGRIRKVYGSFKSKGKHLATSNDDLKSDYTALTIPIPDDEESAIPSSSVSSPPFTKPTTSPPFHATLTLITLTLHTSAFPFLLVVFHSAPRPIGLGFPPSVVGLAIAYMGLVALATQILQYPRLSPRYAYCLLPLAYLLMPVLPSLSASGAVVALGLQAAGVMLARNVEVSEVLLCTRGVSVARVAGPVFGACVYTLCGGGVWWVMAVLTAAGAWSAMFAKESKEMGADGEENRN
ncbi:major facilitator superfamily domain-containing protein [Morchella snyderi]|nr:major facilitator superfamily domain-containing protein [Morchella snyderi]